MATLFDIKRAAEEFLNLADELNERVSAYIDGSTKKADEEAYWKAREADKKFVDMVNSAYEENWTYGLNYELAESFIYC